MRRFWLFALLTPWLISCGTIPVPAAREITDEQTGNTVTVVSKPIVFARERTDVAAHARDYATLVALEVDQSGSFKDFVLLYRWSTVDRRMSPLPGPGMGDLRLSSDGRLIELKALDSVPFGITINQSLHLPRHGAAVIYTYAVDLALLRYIAASRRIVLQLPGELLDTPFQLWDDGRAEMRVFVEQTSAPN